MGKSTSDTFRDLVGGITDDIKEAFDDIIDYDGRDRRRPSRRGRRPEGAWRHREDEDRWYDRDDGWRHREDNGRRYDRDDDHRRRREDGRRRRMDDDYDDDERPYRRTEAAPPRQGGRGGAHAGEEDLAETVRALRSELTALVGTLRQVSATREGTDSGSPPRT
ncbi:hypothetical protein ACGF5F_27085 [Streptomyces sp. NPDC047821]|uniref:hypothetical protein n=1 Tax=Streptomyces sp. NPDC047821 TaxID=3365488 RepID=UPI0037205837